MLEYQMETFAWIIFYIGLLKIFKRTTPKFAVKIEFRSRQGVKSYSSSALEKNLSAGISYVRHGLPPSKVVPREFRPRENSTAHHEHVRDSRSEPRSVARTTAICSCKFIGTLNRLSAFARWRETKRKNKKNKKIEGLRGGNKGRKEEGSTNWRRK